MMTALILITIVLLPLSFAWVKGIDKMQENYPDYKGDDLFEELN